MAVGIVIPNRDFLFRSWSFSRWRGGWRTDNIPGPNDVFSDAFHTPRLLYTNIHGSHAAPWRQRDVGNRMRHPVALPGTARFKTAIQSLQCSTISATPDAELPDIPGSRLQPRQCCSPCQLERTKAIAEYAGRLSGTIEIELSEGLQPHQVLTIGVLFAPAATGRVTAMLAITVNAPSTPASGNVVVAGRGS
jgi:hypothetical protein